MATVFAAVVLHEQVSRSRLAGSVIVVVWDRAARPALERACPHSDWIRHGHATKESQRWRRSRNRRTFIRPDGKEKVTGTGRYTADLVLAGQLMAKFRYADHAHARITRIDASKARALPGVLAVVTHEDVPDVLYGGMVKDRRLFARDTVRFEGDIVAGVAATTAEIAEQAAALIEVDYEPLPVVTDFEAALADDATLVHPDWESLPRLEGARPPPTTRSATRRSSRATSTRRSPPPTSSSRAATRRTRSTASRSSRARSWRSGRATR